MRIQSAILRAAAWIVPAEPRAEWLAEWTAELSYIRERRKRTGTAFCLGAFRDAFWLRRNCPPPHARALLHLDSPAHCLLFLGTLAAATLLLAFLLPGPRDAILPSPYRDADSLAMITEEEHFASRLPHVPIENFQSMVQRTHHLFSGLAFYRPIPERVESVDLSIAVASASLFDLLHVPTPTGGTLILSDTAWRRHFGADPHVAGRVLTIAGRPAIVAGVIPAGSWRLPGRVDAWLLDDQRLAALPPQSKGFVLGHWIQPHREWRSRLMVPREQGGYNMFEYSSLSRVPPILGMLFAVVLSLLILPAVTSLRLGEYPANGGARRWIFLAVKIALILPIVFLGTLDLGSLVVGSVVAGEIQPHGMLIGYVCAFRWALVDQRRRCPVCLRLLILPTRIGSASQVFLETYGTELICTQGHGLLHVPELPASSYGAQRWLLTAQPQPSQGARLN